MSVDIAIYDPPPPRHLAVSALVREIAAPLAEALAPSARRRLAWRIEAEIARAVAVAERLVADELALAAIQGELSRHMNESCCSRPDVVCLTAREMGARESHLLDRLTGWL